MDLVLIDLVLGGNVVPNSKSWFSKINCNFFEARAGKSRGILCDSLPSLMIKVCYLTIFFSKINNFRSPELPPKTPNSLRYIEIQNNVPKGIGRLMGKLRRSTKYVFILKKLNSN